jgi:excisionase family DNA binding protein
VTGREDSKFTPGRASETPDTPETPEALGVETVSTGEVARLLGRSCQTVRDRIEKGELCASQDSGGRWRIPVSELRRLGLHRVASEPRTDLELDAASFVRSLDERLARASEDVVLAASSAVVAGLAERDAALMRAAKRFGEVEAALSSLARARFWQRRGLLRQFEARGLLVSDATTASRGDHAA